jgi:hypothetical protein
MFIATGPTQRSRSFRSVIRQRKIAETGDGGCAPTERGVKRKTASYKHLAPNGAKHNTVLLHFQIESALALFSLPTP